MTVDLIYVHVCRPEAQEEFNQAARRFMESYKEFPAGCDHRLTVAFCNGEPTKMAAYEFGLYGPEWSSIYDGITFRYVRYDQSGMDIGAQQAAALGSDVDFIVSANSRVFFHRPNWLGRMMECREAHGPGVYAAMASYEGCPLGQVWPNPHLRTAFYGMDAKLWREFPHTINSREDSFRFESGEWNIANWCEANGHQARLVTWDGCWERKDWRTPPNLFRRGDQSNCIVWDRHNEIFQSQPEAQAHLEGLANGVPTPAP